MRTVALRVKATRNELIIRGAKNVRISNINRLNPIGQPRRPSRQDVAPVGGEQRVIGDEISQKYSVILSPLPIDSCNILEFMIARKGMVSSRPARICRSWQVGGQFRRDESRGRVP